ncbi:hypothetical protein HK102_011055, partial [Quaeritorhiza haematococci]
MASRALDSAQKLNLNVIRTWGFLDGTPMEGVVFQTFSGGKAFVNEGENGLGRLDRVIKLAKDRGLRLIIPLVNNWKDYGGMDVYVRALASNPQNHDQFYTDPNVKAAYKNYVRTVVTRYNPLTGLRYNEDPTIMAWEVANEPRCRTDGPNPLPPSKSCTATTITTWVDEMSLYIRSLTPSPQLIASGDEGFFTRPDQSLPWPYRDTWDGVDFEALINLRGIDFGVFHMYPDHWGFASSWDQEVKF